MPARGARPLPSSAARALHSRGGVALTEYKRKRNFKRTPEPSGAKRRKRSARGPIFVVQKHAARNLHYDFRLEHGGVLWSWAVPKGPSLDPKVKRLAMQVEDHPLDYGDFEGVIPRGEYGGGTVLLWDTGKWHPEGDPKEGYARGRLDFTLEGEKLRGRWHLIRTRPRGGSLRGARTWLLFKGSDDEARRGPKADVVAESPDSVASGRSLEQVGESADRVWRSNRRRRRPQGRDPLPDFVPPQLATLVAAPPDGDEWLHEQKLDGYRIQARIDGGEVKLLSRRGNDWSKRIPALVRALRSLSLERALLDGEVVLLREGLSDFQALQNALSEGSESECVYCVFDCLHLDGRDLRALPLLERKQRLRDALRGADARIQYSDHMVGHGAEFFRGACELGAEGTVCKRAEAPYASGRGRTWLKVKCTARQEFVIGGYTAPAGARKHLGALLLGVYDEGGELRYAGKVGTGFDARSLGELAARLGPLEQPRAPFADPPRGSAARGVRWVRPELVAEVELVERTRAGRVRHAAFRGLREDKPAKQVKLEIPVSAPIELTHPDRVVFPDLELTKRGVAEYYRTVAERMLPHVAGRPLMVLRCPDGIGDDCFFQKHPSRGQPEAIHGVDIRESGGVKKYLTVVDVEGLVGLVQMGGLEVHTWGSRAPDVEHADVLTFDLDPGPGVPWARTVAAARELRERLSARGLESFCKTTGGKGLHVVAPLAPRSGWNEVKEFSRALAEEMVADAPDQYLAFASKSERRGKIFLDWLRNTRGSTAVCAYSLRAREGAPVATPIAWSELGPRLDPARFDVRSVPARLARQRRDPWEGYAELRQALPAR